MTQWRTLRNNCGRLYRTNLGDFWQISTTVQDPSVPNMPLETPAAPGGYYAILYRWTGAAWVKAKLMVYVGGSFQDATLKVWAAGEWKTVDTTGV